MTTPLQFPSSPTSSAPVVDTQTNSTNNPTTAIARKALANSHSTSQGIHRILLTDVFQRTLEYLDPYTIRTLNLVNSHLTTALHKGMPSLITMACLAQVESKNGYKNPMHETTYKKFRHLGVCTFPSIQHLKLCLPITTQKLNEILSCFTTLLSLHIREARNLTDDSLVQISRFSHLTSLHFTNGKKISEKGLYFLTQLPLIYLCFSGSGKDSNINDACLKHIAKINTLQRLYLLQCPMITDRGLFELTRLSKLEKLDIIESNQITNLGVSYIMQMPSMKKLSLGGFFLNEEGHYSEAEDGEGQITENGLALFARFPHIKLKLAPSMTGIDDEAINRLVRLGIHVTQLKYK